MYVVGGVGSGDWRGRLRVVGWFLGGLGWVEREIRKILFSPLIR